MADTRRSRDALIALMPDNITYDISAQDLRDFVVSALCTFGPMITVNSAITASINRRHRCIDLGTPANYILTLPPVAGNDDQLVDVLIDRTMTKLLTVKGNGAELIDGVNTRIMHAGESATLQVINGEWKKISGKTIPMIGAMSRSISHPFAGAQQVQVAHDTTNLARPAAIVNLPTCRFEIQRPGNYEVSVQAKGWDNVGTYQICMTTAWLTTTTGLDRTTMTNYTSAFPYAACNGKLLNLSVNDWVYQTVYQNDGASTTRSCTSLWIVLTEIPQW